MTRFAAIFCAVFLLLTIGAQAAVDPSEYLADPALQARAETLYGQIRCVVCQSESIADSNATVARDMRAMIRTRLKAGDDNQSIIAYLHSRFGDAVLMKPPMEGKTIALWIGPFIVLLAGFFIVRGVFKRGAAS